LLESDEGGVGVGFQKHAECPRGDFVESAELFGVVVGAHFAVGDGGHGGFSSRTVFLQLYTFSVFEPRMLINKGIGGKQFMGWKPTFLTSKLLVWKKT